MKPEYLSLHMGAHRIAQTKLRSIHFGQFLFNITEIAFHVHSIIICPLVGLLIAAIILLVDSIGKNIVEIIMSDVASNLLAILVCLIVAIFLSLLFIYNNFKRISSKAYDIKKSQESLFETKVAKTLDKSLKLVESGFEYVVEIDGVKIFRKRL